MLTPHPCSIPRYHRSLGAATGGGPSARVWGPPLPPQFAAEVRLAVYSAFQSKDYHSEVRKKIHSALDELAKAQAEAKAKAAAEARAAAAVQRQQDMQQQQQPGSSAVAPHAAGVKRAAPADASGAAAHPAAKVSKQAAGSVAENAAAAGAKAAAAQGEASPPPPPPGQADTAAPSGGAQPRQGASGPAQPGAAAQQQPSASAASGDGLASPGHGSAKDRGLLHDAGVGALLGAVLDSAAPSAPRSHERSRRAAPPQPPQPPAPGNAAQPAAAAPGTSAAAPAPAAAASVEEVAQALSDADEDELAPEAQRQAFAEQQRLAAARSEAALAALRQIVEQLIRTDAKRHSDSGGFREPVTDEVAADYSSMIAQPFCLLDVRAKLDGGVYAHGALPTGQPRYDQGSLDLLQKDLDLIYSNARTYNAENGEWLGYAQEFRKDCTKVVNKLWGDLQDKINPGRRRR